MMERSMMTSGAKKSFEFRMCKKVAELTQVVHMLFTRNHEKEVEVEALKDAYEKEILNVISDAKSQISALEQQVASSSAGGEEQLRKAREALELEWKARLQAEIKKTDQAQKETAIEKAEVEKLHKLLTGARADIESLRSGVSSEINNKDSELEKSRRDNASLKARLSEFSAASDQREKALQSQLSELQQDHEKLQHVHNEQQQRIKEIAASKEGLLSKMKQLEIELKLTKRELASRPRGGSGELPREEPYEYSEELERLRQEVQRYRMELSNRENNFNRMFTEQNPLHVVDRRGASREMSLLSSGGRMMREQTFSPGSGGDALQVQIDGRVKASNQSSRLPPMSSNGIRRTNPLAKLAKPRPSRH